LSPIPAAGHPAAPGTAPVADPLTLFLAAHRQALPAKRGPRRFNAGEHVWLGSHGAARARARCKKAGDGDIDESVFEAIPRHDGRETLSYGELVALSGDFYATPDDLFDEKPSPLPWLWEANDLGDLRRSFDKELDWIEHRLAHSGDAASYPDENLRLAWNAKSYVELALRNTDHFGWHNLCAYVHWHREALALAASPGARRADSEDFRRALFMNAFADHFLTDCFAAGHIRVPRAEIRDWAQARGLDEKIAGALSKLLHDQDGHVDVHSLHGEHEDGQRCADDGLLVTDSAGDAWRTYCDGQLFLGGSATSPAVEHAVDAVADSVVEFLLAWRKGDQPEAVYRATHRVPLPHPDAPTLIQKFPADMPEADFERLWQSVSWYTKVPWISGLQRGHLRDLFVALPALMAQFRAHIAEAAQAPELALRIDADTLRACRQLA
jgi:hypothetical protein